VIEELAETNWKSVWRRERVMGSDLGSAARRDFHSSGSARGKRKSPRLIVKSAPGKPFDFDIEAKPILSVSASRRAWKLRRNM